MRIDTDLVAITCVLNTVRTTVPCTYSRSSKALLSSSVEYAVPSDRTTEYRTAVLHGRRR